MKTRVCGHTNISETNTYNIEVTTVGIKRMSAEEGVDLSWIRTRKKPDVATVADGGGSANNPTLLSRVKAKVPSMSMPSMSMPSIGGGGGGNADTATVNEMSRGLLMKL